MNEDAPLRAGEDGLRASAWRVRSTGARRSANIRENRPLKRVR